MKRSALAIVVLLLALVVPKASFAGDPLEDFPDPEAAQTLDAEAHALLQQGRYVEACPKLEESLRLSPGLGTELDLADCNERIGKLAAAWSGFALAAARAKVAGEPLRERLASKRARALEPRLPRLVIDVPEALPGLEVKRDGVAVDAATWGAAFAVDPGRHRVTVTAPGKQRWVATIESYEGATTRVEVPRELVDLPEDHAPCPPPVLVVEPGVKRRTLAWLSASADAVGATVAALVSDLASMLPAPPPSAERASAQ